MLKNCMASTHFQTRRLRNIRREMRRHVLAYNLKNVAAILGIGGVIKAMRSMKA